MIPKTILCIALLIMTMVAASPPAEAQGFVQVIDDTVKDSETVASPWRNHTSPHIRVWTQATGSDSIKTNLYIQFRMAGVDTSARVLLDSIITQSSRYFMVNTGGAAYRIVSFGMIVRNAHVAPFNRLRVKVDERPYGP